MEKKKALEAGFKLTQLREIGPHYVRTPRILGRRARGPQGRGHRDQGQKKVYDRYDKYLNGCQVLRLGSHQRASVHAAEVIFAACRITATSFVG